MRQLILLALIIMMLNLPTVVVHGQEQGEPTCSFEPTYEILLNLMQEVNTWEELQRFDRDLSASLAFCQDLYFTGTGDEVLGPMNIPAGIYTIGVTGEITAAAGETLAGHCDIVFLFTAGAATFTEEGFRSDGCSQMISIDSSTSWTLQLAPVELFDIVTEEEATLAWEAFFEGNLPITNLYFCPQNHLNQGHVDSLTARFPEPVINCSYDEYVMMCSVEDVTAEPVEDEPSEDDTSEDQAVQEDVSLIPIAEMAIRDGLLCDIQFSE
jgi:hypothetical protein